MRDVTRRAWRAGVMAGLLVVGIAGLSTCVTGVEQDTVTYDAKADRFETLMVVTHMGVGNSGDFDDLMELYGRRNEWIVGILPLGSGAWSIISGVGVVRMGEHQFGWAHILGSGQVSEAQETGVELGKATVTPGEFFSEGGEIGYYQASSVPGKLVDEALAETSKGWLAKTVKEAVEGELARRAAGGRRCSWQELEKGLMRGSGDGAAATEPEVPGILAALEDESLRNLLKAVADGTLAVKRNKQVVSVVLPVTRGDAGEAAKLAKAGLKEAGENLAGEADDKKVARATQKAWNLVEGAVKIHGDGKGLTVAVDLVKFSMATAALSRRSDDTATLGSLLTNESTTFGPASRPTSGPASQAATRKAPPDLAKLLKERGVVVDTQLTAAKIVKDFRVGKLRGYPAVEGTAVEGAGK